MIYMNLANLPSVVRILLAAKDSDLIFKDVNTILFKYCKEKLYPSEILVGVNNEYKNLLHLVISANLTASKYEGLRAKREDLDRQ